MTITAKQKRLHLPITIFVVSLILFAALPFSGWKILLIMLMTISLCAVISNHIDQIHKAVSGWLSRDGWK